MEWAWRQQLFMLLQSGGVGFLLGILYDIFSAVGRVRRFTRSAVFICDVTYFIAAALVTFYASLAIMDGRLHPLLFAGCAIGFASQHVSVSRYFRRLVSTVCSFSVRSWRCCKRCLAWPFLKAKSLAKLCCDKICKKCFKKSKNL